MVDWSCYTKKTIKQFKNIKVINFYGGPCSGKSVTSAHLFSHLKRHNIKTELVGEFAKELIYLGNESQLVNQVYIMGSQYRKLKDLQRHGIDVAISDAPLMLQLVYCQGKSYYEEIAALINKINSEFDNVDIFLKRVKPYQTYGRVHNEYEAKALDEKIWAAMKGDFHYVTNGDDNGISYISDEVLEIADKQLLDKY